MKKSLVSIAVGLATLLCSCSDQAESLLGTENSTTISKKGNIEIVVNSGAKSRGAITVKENPVTHAEFLLTYPNGKTTSEMWTNSDSTKSILFPYYESGKYTLEVVENGGTDDSTVYDNTFEVKVGSNYTVNVDLGMSIKVVVNGTKIDDSTVVDDSLAVEAFDGIWVPSHNTKGSFTTIKMLDSALVATLNLAFTEPYVWTGVRFIPNYHFGWYKGIELNYMSSDTLFMSLTNESQEIVRTLQLPPSKGENKILYLDDFQIPDWTIDTLNINDCKRIDVIFDIFCDSTKGPKEIIADLEIYNIRPY